MTDMTTVVLAGIRNIACDREGMATSEPALSPETAPVDDWNDGAAAPAPSPPEGAGPDDSDGEEEEVADDGDGPSSMQLGFADELDDDDEIMFSDPDWSTWDGGRIGGQPFWLDPKALPPTSELECSGCGDPLSFLLQIYCPLDDVAAAFHRMLFLFCCRRGSCSG